MSATDPAIATVLHDSEAAAPESAFRHTVLVGVLAGIIGVYLAAIGLLLLLHERAIIVGVLSLGHATLLATGIGAGIAAARGHEGLGARLLRGLIAGAIAGGVLALLPLLMTAVSLRYMFISLSPQLLQMLTFDADTVGQGCLMLIAG
ncbi:MAG: hypothetical protein JSR21_13040, partial [Proteobacteria bacterium]|nr:hypothetical protein [Pseudomonadota bacterium]